VGHGHSEPGHGHDHGHGLSAASAHRGRLLVACLLTAGYLVVEVVTAVATSSLTLLSDAAHMFTDLTGLVLALTAVTVAAKSRPRGGHTFGLHRMETLAALANAVLLFGVAGYVVFEAVSRLREPATIPAVPMLVVAVVGLAVNIGSYLLLRSGARSSLAVRAAATEVFADALGSVGVLVAGGIIAITGATWVDPAVALLLAALILPRTWRLARQAVRVLVEAAPEHVDLSALEHELATLPDVVDVHDLHVWTLTSGMELATAHLAVRPGTDVHPVLDAARAVLVDGYGIPHATFQVEPTDHTVCREVDW
jgi:cobalt-zinc-cadmium efflux system protein